MSRNSSDKKSRLFWRDLHAVTGFWISFFTLFLLLSGLPWAKSWGGLLKEVRHIGSGKVVQQDWTTGRTSELAERQKMNMTVGGESEHADHKHMVDKNGIHKMMMPKTDYSPLDRMVATVHPLLGAPPGRTASYAPLLVVVILVLGVLLPFLGMSLVMTLLLEQLVLRHIPSARTFLGLN